MSQIEPVTPPALVAPPPVPKRRLQLGELSPGDLMREKTMARQDAWEAHLAHSRGAWPRPEADSLMCALCGSDAEVPSEVVSMCALCRELVDGGLRSAFAVLLALFGRVVPEGGGTPMTWLDAAGGESRSSYRAHCSQCGHRGWVGGMGWCGGIFIGHPGGRATVPEARARLVRWPGVWSDFSPKDEGWDEESGYDSDGGDWWTIRTPVAFCLGPLCGEVWGGDYQRVRSRGGALSIARFGYSDYSDPGLVAEKMAEQIPTAARGLARAGWVGCRGCGAPAKRGGWYCCGCE